MKYFVFLKRKDMPPLKVDAADAKCCVKAMANNAVVEVKGGFYSGFLIDCVIPVEKNKPTPKLFLEGEGQNIVSRETKQKVDQEIRDRFKPKTDKEVFENEVKKLHRAARNIF